MQLTVKEAAKELNVAEKTVYRWIQSGGLPAYRVAGEYRINRAMLYDWAGSRKGRFGDSSPAPVAVAAAAAGAPSAAGEPDSNALPVLSAMLEAGGIHKGIPGTTKADVLKAAVAVLSLPEQLNRDFLVQALVMREQLQSTGIGDGVAIPHVRNPSVLGLSTPQVALFFLETPIAYDSLDGKPVHALFMPLAPNVRIHLHLLGKIAFSLRQTAVKELVARAAEPAEILAAFRALEAGNA